MRLFVAVDLTDEARRAVAAEQKRLVAGLGAAADSIRWVQPDQMHLTLVFLGEVDDARVPAVVEMCHRPLDTRPFELEFAGIGVFPPRGAPRALWIGVGDGTEYLVALQRNVAARTKNSGFAG
ncbi:MAG: RNA 2',3'-cyclic phosphodiesterase, partial [Acidobacteria bacterium]|nr:RNA 2',3'-cyclic phosphodiesterase [Acidobacteriota bacterium]